MFYKAFLCSLVLVASSLPAAAQTTAAEPLVEEIDCDDEANKEEDECLGLIGGTSYAPVIGLLIVGGALAAVASGGGGGGNSSSPSTN